MRPQEKSNLKLAISAVVPVVVVVVIVIVVLNAIFETESPSLPPQPSPSGQLYPLVFEPFVSAKLEGPFPFGGVVCKEDAKKLNTVKIQAGHKGIYVCLRLTVENTSDEGIWSDRALHVRITGLDSQDAAYHALTLQQYMEWTRVGYLRAHRQRTILPVAFLPAGAVGKELCFRVEIRMRGYRKTQRSWRKFGHSQACVAVER